METDMIFFVQIITFCCDLSRFFRVLSLLLFFNSLRFFVLGKNLSVIRSRKWFELGERIFESFARAFYRSLVNKLLREKYLQQVIEKSFVVWICHKWVVLLVRSVKSCYIVIDIVKLVRFICRDINSSMIKLVNEKRKKNQGYQKAKYSKWDNKLRFEEKIADFHHEW